ncbi:MAG: hypothetical protein GTO46_11200 [Gemmatimonadetes bacterium]|nr:hypothetical protein [Gemmatimonadota bacterium]
MNAQQDATELDRLIRLYIYGRFLEDARPPTVEQTAEALQATSAAVTLAYERLARKRVLVLERGGREIRMAMPFSAVETPFEVRAIERQWYANCAWDALGIPAMLNCDARIVTRCGDCGEPVTVAVMDGEVVGGKEVIHFAVPALRWWEDIVFT